MLTTMTIDEPRSPCAQPAQSHAFRRHGRGHAAGSSHVHPEPERPKRRGRRARPGRRPEPALDQHRAPAVGRPRVARGALRLPRPRLRGRLQPEPAPEGRRVRRLPIHRPALPRPTTRRWGASTRPSSTCSSAPTTSSHCPTSRSSRSSTLFERCRTSRGPARGSCSPRAPGYLLYKIVDDCVDASFPDAAQDGQQARAPRGRHLRGRALLSRSCATSRTSSRRSSTSAASCARSARRSRTSRRT